MRNKVHLLKRAAGIEMIASQDHPLALSSGIHQGTTEQRAARLGDVHSAAHSAYSSSSLSQVRQPTVLSEQHSSHFD